MLLPAHDADTMQFSKLIFTCEFRYIRYFFCIFKLDMRKYL